MTMVSCKKNEGAIVLLLIIFFVFSGETSEILDILEMHGVRATFFIVGSTIEGNPMYNKVLKRILNDGHTLGTHTYSHADLTSLGADGIKYELETAGDLIERASGERPKILRPPYG